LNKFELQASALNGIKGFEQVWENLRRAMVSAGSGDTGEKQIDRAGYDDRNRSIRGSPPNASRAREKLFPI
jgi:hypothetical protein